MHINDRVYLSKFELGSDPYDDDDELEFIRFNDGSDPDEFSDEDELFWVDDTWDKYI
jgi:hypothetical protein